MGAGSRFMTMSVSLSTLHLRMIGSEHRENRKQQLVSKSPSLAVDQLVYPLLGA